MPTHAPRRTQDGLVADQRAARPGFIVGHPYAGEMDHCAGVHVFVRAGEMIYRTTLWGDVVDGTVWRYTRHPSLATLYTSFDDAIDATHWNLVRSEMVIPVNGATVPPESVRAGLDGRTAPFLSMPTLHEAR